MTIRDVAARAGVSAMTVSNVINGAGKVGEATRRRVRAAIAELGYAPNPAARGLASPGAARMGVVYADARSAFVSAALVAAMETASSVGVQLLARDCTALSPEAWPDALRALVRTGARALLLLPPFAEALSGTPVIAELGLPVAAIGTGSGLPDMLTVRIDEQAAAEAMTGLLLARGHCRIAFIAGPPAHSGSLSRRKGYETALAKHGLAVSPELIAQGAYSFESGLDATRRLLALAEPPSAIFAANDEMAAAAAWIAHSLGLKLPGALAIAGFDDTPLAERVFPPLTAVRQPIEEMAVRASELLIGAMRDGGERLSQDVVLDFALVERSSTAEA